MTQEKAYPVELALAEPLAADIEAGAAFALVLALETKSGRDLAGANFKVFDGEKVVAEGVLPAIVRHDPNSDDCDPRNGPVELRDTVRLTLLAPCEIGVFQWTIVLPNQDISGVEHAQASVSFSFKTAEHRTSLAAWDIPSPVVTGERFTFKIGAKCSACCALNGLDIELRSGDGKFLAIGKLGERWPGTEGLHWTTLEAIAPTQEGVCQWSVAFSPCHPGLPHQGSSAAVSVMTVAPARHEVAVAIVERGSARPIGDAQVRLGFHRSATDENGIARFKVAPGQHRLFVWKASHAAPEQIIDVAHDLDLVVEAEALPEEDPYAHWQG